AVRVAPHGHRDLGVRPRDGAADQGPRQHRRRTVGASGAPPAQRANGANHRRGLVRERVATAIRCDGGGAARVRDGHLDGRLVPPGRRSDLRRAAGRHRGWTRATRAAAARVRRAVRTPAARQRPEQPSVTVARCGPGTRRATDTSPLLSMQENRPAPSVSSENGAELTSGDGAEGRRDRPLRALRDTSRGTNVSTLRDSDSHVTVAGDLPPRRPVTSTKRTVSTTRTPPATCVAEERASTSRAESGRSPPPPRHLATTTPTWPARSSAAGWPHPHEERGGFMRGGISRVGRAGRRHTHNRDWAARDEAHPVAI